MKTAVLLGGSLAEEREALRGDRIIVQMAIEIKFAPRDTPVPDMNATWFMSAARNEYEKRGGTHAVSIGGVAAAIREAYDNLNDADRDYEDVKDDKIMKGEK